MFILGSGVLLYGWTAFIKEREKKENQEKKEKKENTTSLENTIVILSRLE